MQLPTEIVLADGGKEAVIWIVLAIIWAVAQAVTKSRQKRINRPPPPPKPRGALQSDLEKFFTELERQQKPAAQPPPAQKHAAPKPPPAPRSQPVMAAPPAPVRKHVRHVPKATRKYVAPPPPAPRSVPIAVPEVTPTPLAEYGDFGGLAKGSMRSAGLFMSTQGFKFPTISLAPVGTSRGSSTATHLVMGKNALRTAIVARLVLGPPKAYGTPSSWPDYD